MKKTFLLIIVAALVTFCFSLGLGFADPLPTTSDDSRHFLWGEMVKGGVKFTIRNVEIKEWLAVPAVLPKETVMAPLGPVNMIALTYDLSNETENRKIDLTKDIDFNLTDEFGNQYKKLLKPTNYANPIMIANKHFPSLYPGESFTSTIFFEAPVSTSEVLNFTIDAKNIGVADPALFHLPVARALPLPKSDQTTHNDDDFKIVIPSNLKFVKPGDIIPVKVELAEKAEQNLARIYVITPFYVFEDLKSSRKYEVHVPKDQQDGPLTVIVLARWEEDGQEQTLSKSFTITVENKQTPCVEDCDDTTGAAHGEL